jgi:tetratricopeptide (TPR) repeat protein
LSSNLALSKLNTAIDGNSSCAEAFFHRGRARKHLLTLTQTCDNYDDLVLEYLADFVRAVELEPQSDEYLARLAFEKLAFTQDLERQCATNSIHDEGNMALKSLALSWAHTVEIARSALNLKSITIPNRILALEALCHGLFATSQHEEFEQFINDWIGASGRTLAAANALSLKGKFLAEVKQNPDAALRIWTSALEFQPDHVEILVHQASLFRLLGRSKEAIAIWNKLTSLRPESADFWYRGAADHELCGDKESAVSVLKKALELSPHHLFALNDLAFHHISSGAWAEAQPLLQDVLTQGPNDDIPWINMANVLYHLKEYSQALRSIENAFSAHRVGNRPPSAEEWLIKAAILRAMVSETASASSSEEADSSTPQPSTSANEGEIVKCFVMALKAVDKLEKAQAHFEYADYLVSKGQQDVAKRQMGLALQQQPKATAATLNLTRLNLHPETVSLFGSLK